MNEPSARSPIMVREPALRDRLAATAQPSALPAEEIAAAALSPAPGKQPPDDQPPQPAKAKDRQAQTGLQPLNMSGSLGILAVVVILTLSAGMVVLLYSQLRLSPAVGDVLGEPVGLLAGFSLLMLMTVIYLVAKQAATRRGQRRMIEQLLEQEAVACGLRKNPLTDYHHPDVCREILMQQASHAARLQAPLSLLELSISGLNQLAQDTDVRTKGYLMIRPKHQPEIAEWVRKMKELCRATDSVLRWTPGSFLLAFPEVAGVELTPIRERLRQSLERWVEERYQAGFRPELQWRGATSSSLDSCGDILLETQRLLESQDRNQQRRASQHPRAGSAPPLRDKSISLALELEICGEDQHKKFFEQKILTERVSADRFWCPLDQPLMEQALLTISAPDGAFCEQGLLARWIPRQQGRLAEIQFLRPPDRWVIRGQA